MRRVKVTKEQGQGEAGGDVRENKENGRQCDVGTVKCTNAVEIDGGSSWCQIDSDFPPAGPRPKHEIV